jgi:hypothetical protein
MTDRRWRGVMSFQQFRARWRAWYTSGRSTVDPYYDDGDDYPEGSTSYDFDYDGYLSDLWYRDSVDRWFSTRKAPTVL